MSMHNTSMTPDTVNKITQTHLKRRLYNTLYDKRAIVLVEHEAWQMKTMLS